MPADRDPAPPPLDPTGARAAAEAAEGRARIYRDLALQAQQNAQHYATLLASALGIPSVDTLSCAPRSEGPADRRFVRVGEPDAPPGLYAGDGAGGWVLEGAAFAALGADNRLRPEMAPASDGVHVNGTAKSTDQEDLEDLLNTAPAHSTVHLSPNAVYRVTTPIDTARMAPGVRVDMRGATVLQVAPLRRSESVLWIRQHGVVVENGAIVLDAARRPAPQRWTGAQTDASSALRVGEYRSGRRWDGFRASHLRLEGTQYGLYLTHVDRAQADHLSGSGFLRVAPAGGRNNSALVYARDTPGLGLSVIDGDAWGSLVIVALSSRGVTARQLTGRNLQDNGLYISSGYDCLADGCRFEGVPGSAVKARGAGHTIRNVRATNVGIGVNMTPTRAGDRGGLVQDVVVRGIGAFGISVSDAYDAHLPGVTISDAELYQGGQPTRALVYVEGGPDARRRGSGHAVRNVYGAFDRVPGRDVPGLLLRFTDGATVSAVEFEGVATRSGPRHYGIMMYGATGSAVQSGILRTFARAVSLVAGSDGNLLRDITAIDCRSAVYEATSDRNVVRGGRWSGSWGNFGRAGGGRASRRYN